MEIFLIVIGVFIIIPAIVLIIYYFNKNEKEQKIEEERYNKFRKEHVVDREKINRFNLSSQERYGLSGEDYVAKMLEGFTKQTESYVFNGVTLKDDYGNTTEIDHIFICKGGIYVIETKTLKGTIYGGREDEEWLQEKDNVLESKPIRNPVKQNEGHIRFLSRLFPNNPPKIKSLVIILKANIRNVDCKYVYDEIDARDYLKDEISRGKYSEDYIRRMNNQIRSILNKYGTTAKEHKNHLNDVLD